MTIRTIICDACKAEGAREISYFVDRRMDAAGSMENEYETIDLCHAHMAALLNELLHRKSTFAEADKYLPIVRRFRKT